ncbi:MAG: M28 family peptidase [Planctomycetes bacterium]|nr:M28 family peptidase [Planctomycetota bacterium]
MLRSTALFPVLLWSAVLTAQTAEAAPAVPEPPQALATIRKADLLAHANWLADGARAGRLTGSPEQEAAAAYIEAHFRKLGLEPLGDTDADGARSFRQRYPIARTTLAPKSRLQFGDLSLEDGFALLGKQPGEHAVQGKLRFLGLGRTRGSQAELPADTTLDGDVAVVVARAPRGRLDRQLGVEQKFLMSFGTLGQIGRTAGNLAKKGAGAVVFLLLEDPVGLTDVLNYVALSPGKDLVEATFPGAQPVLGGLGALAGGEGGGSVPTCVLSIAASEKVLAVLGLDRAAVAAFVAGDGDLPPAKADLAAALTFAVTHEAQASACNVVAVLRGSDPQLAAEAVVYSAHMDHVGRRMDGAVFHGADDNASGTAGLLAIASAFAGSAARPRRSVVFLSVSGEELGLWGSQFYADHPTWPIEQIVANVNTDMIGRSGPESGPKEVGATPSHERSEYTTLVRDAAGFAAKLGIELVSADKYWDRSDHYNFAQKGIPVVFFCNGEHEDYHQVTDTPDKLDGDKMERLAQLAFWTGWAVAADDERPRRLGRREGWR